MAVRALLAQLVEHLHGKEGVSGSSPEEGFTEHPAKRLLELSQWETTVTRGHSRALPGVPSSGVSAGGIRLDQAHPNRLDPLCTTQGPAESARHIEMSGKGDPGVAHVQHGGDSFGENRWSVVGAQPKRRVRRERRARQGIPLFPDHFERGCRLLPDRPSPRKTAANTKKTAPMPEESRVKSTIATMRNATPARTLPSACFDISWL
jgi:hypothetical protein